ncbi:MAG: adenylate kinase [Proteobacteria bacterium]|nr:adenylate kinase [Cystobacterineae bacterium]MCL2258620.1 adenylate kinase [Cystobacterineae bacterium]MCL2315020.1 adenylate kinase [Pseudomonadota bacterium]
MNLILFGAPGAGKGTQAGNLWKKFGIPHIATGDILREAIRKGTELGKEVAPYLEVGKLAPDALVSGLVLERLSARDCEGGFVLDGYPRTLPQVEVLEEALKEKKKRIDRVISLDVPQEVLLQRIMERGRPDDNMEAMRRRLVDYRNLTEQAKKEYAARNLLAAIDGIGTTEEVFERILASLPQNS